MTFHMTSFFAYRFQCFYLFGKSCIRRFLCLFYFIYMCIYLQRSLHANTYSRNYTYSIHVTTYTRVNLNPNWVVIKVRSFINQTNKRNFLANPVYFEYVHVFMCNNLTVQCMPTNEGLCKQMLSLVWVNTCERFPLCGFIE